jgi:arylsulfatase
MLTYLMVAPVVAQDSASERVDLPSDRAVLPILERQYPHSTVFDARNAKPPPWFEVKAPEVD